MMVLIVMLMVPGFCRDQNKRQGDTRGQGGTKKVLMPEFFWCQKISGTSKVRSP